MEKEVLSVGEVAVLLGCSKATIYRYVKSRELRPWRAKGRRTALLFLRRKVVEMLAGAAQRN